MSAIFGILKHHSQAVVQSEIKIMGQTMLHRGPDYQGFWLQGSIGLGHGMFRTTPESLHEKLPFQDSESKLVITADARIDNREELAKALGLSQAVKEGKPDSYFILAAYKKWGKRCVNQLLGDFSFAVWDPRDKRLFCARDHIGVKPFNYYTDQNTFVFASEVRAILKAPHVPKKINEGRIADFLVTALEGIDKTSTFFEKIYRLPPAHTLIVENGRVSTQCYWEPDIEKRIVLASDVDYVAAFTEIYTDSIDKRLRGNGNVASMLSGGVDSSSIVGIARNLHHAKTGQPFSVFSAVSPAEKQDCRETYFINAVLNQGGLSAKSISVDDLNDFNENISKVVSEAQEPFDPMIMIIAVYLLAKKSNYRVILDGIDGDVITSLSPSYPTILLKDGKHYEALSAMFMQNKNYYAGRTSRSGILYQNLRAAYTPVILRQLRNALRKRGHLEMQDNGIISKEFSKKIHLTDRFSQLHSNNCNKLPQSFHALHATSILHPYLTVGVERYDRVAALCGIEPRHPLLDKRVVEFMLAIPWDQKVRLGWNKHLLRRSSEQVLPDEVCWRQGWEHNGWDFTCKWLQINSKDVLTTVKKMSTDMTQYLNTSLLNETIGQYITSGSKSKTKETIVEAYYLGNWLHNIRNL